MARCNIESCFLIYKHQYLNDNFLLSTIKTRTKKLSRKETKPCVLSTAADVLLSLEPVVGKEDNIISKTCNESNEKTDERLIKRHRMSGNLLPYQFFTLTCYLLITHFCLKPQIRSFLLAMFYSRFRMQKTLLLKHAKVLPQLP